MLNSSSDEYEVPWLEWIPLAVVVENTSTSNDNVNLVLCVRSRWPWQWRETAEREHGLQGAALENSDGMLACWTWYSFLSVGNMDHSA